MTKEKGLLNFVSQNDLDKIHLASMNILTGLGIKIEDPEIRALLNEQGCRIENGRVKFDSDLIQKVLANIKKEVTLSNRSGRTVTLQPGQVISHSTGGIPHIVDFKTGQKRKASLKDVVATIAVMNKLDQLDLPCALLYPEDVPDQISQVLQAEYLLRYSQKPVYGPGISSPGEAKYIVKLFQAYAGSSVSLSENPIGVVGVSPESPLYYPKVITDTMKIIIGAGIPTVMLVAPIAGISAPMTISGGLAQLNTNMLAFAVMAYLINPKTPVIYGARMNFPNMKNGYSIWGLPDVGIASSIAVQLASYYGFLSDVYGLSCSSCAFDNQAGYEKAINGLLPVLAGANLISGFGSMASLTMASYEQLVIDNETFAALRKVKRGVSVNDDTLALDIIADVIGGGTYLEQEHTIRHLRNGELFIPRLGFDRTWNEWETSGQKEIKEKAYECVNQILDGNENENGYLPRELEKEICQIIDEAHRELVLK